MINFYATCHLAECEKQGNDIIETIKQRQNLAFPFEMVHIETRQEAKEQKWYHDNCHICQVYDYDT